MKKIFYLLCFAMSVNVSFGATRLVTNTDDSGSGSLRDAISIANPGDIVRISNTLLGSGNQTITLLSRIDITKGIFIKGAYNSTDTVLISGGNANQLFYIYMTTGSVLPNVDMDSVVLINGSATGDYGGAVQIDYHTVDGTVYFRNSIFRNNSAQDGGAIGSYRNPVGSPKCKVKVEVHHCTFSNNSATSNGGAIAFHMRSSQSSEPKVELDVFYSNFLNNSCASKGGAIYAYAYCFEGATISPDVASTLINIVRSTISYNNCGTEGGAIYTIATDNTSGYTTLAEVTLNTSTLTNNGAISNGGGIFCHSSDFAHVKLFNSTVAYNTTFLDGSAFYILSDATANVENSRAELEAAGSIVAHNNGNANYNNSAYISGGYHHVFNSNAYNLFDFDYDHFPDLEYPLWWNENYYNIAGNEIIFAPLTQNSYGTYSLVPILGNYGINRGSEFDFDDAQNGPILGIRDVGAAESDICTPIPFGVSQSICQGSSYNFYGQNLTTAGTYTHTIVTAGQCDTLVTLALSLQNPVTPTITFTANPGNTIMTGTLVSLTATITNGGANPTYTWLANGSPINGAPNAPNVQSSTLVNGVVISCQLTSDQGCVTTTTVVSNAITFLVHPNNDEACNGINLPVNPTCVSQFFANHIATNTTNVGAFSCVTTSSKDIWFKFTAPASGNVAIYTYAGTLTDAVMGVYLGSNCSSLFEVGCIDDDGANQMPQGIVTGATPGTVYYIRVASYGTTASGNFSICVVDQGNPATITEIDLNSSLIYPNPANDVLNFKFNTDGDQHVAILNYLGQRVVERTFQGNENSLSLVDLRPGVYMVEISNSSGKTVEQLIINR